MKSRWVLIVAAAVLIAGGALQGLHLRDMSGGDQTRPVQPVELKRRIPATLPGWTVRDEPLGPNESVRSAVERTLNYDDYVYRLYRRSNLTVGVYVAYWAPGRMPVQKVASHTPDRCWTENGWTCLASRFHETLATPGTTLRAAQWRHFRAPGTGDQREYVVYWHLVGMGLHDYGERFHASPGLFRWWRDALAYALAGSQEQYFIRLTSTVPFERLTGEAGWDELLGAIAKLGLAAPQSNS